MCVCGIHVMLSGEVKPCMLYHTVIGCGFYVLSFSSLSLCLSLSLPLHFLSLIICPVRVLITSVPASSCLSYTVWLLVKTSALYHQCDAPSIDLALWSICCLDHVHREVCEMGGKGEERVETEERELHSLLPLPPPLPMLVSSLAPAFI